MSSYRIILADDHALIRQGVGKILGGVAGLEVSGEAGDGVELLALLEKAIPDLVILDISMPNLRGIEVLRDIKRKHAAVKILVLTMHKEYLHQALTAGADGYLLKEDADRELFAAIETIREGKVYRSPRLRGVLTGGHMRLSKALTLREEEVLKLVVHGKTNAEIGQELFISTRTVESHRANLLKKLHLKNTAALVNYAIERGYL
jgi:DNA-binding NarL/FixJ family response regulator